MNGWSSQTRLIEGKGCPQRDHFPLLYCRALYLWIWHGAAGLKVQGNRTAAQRRTITTSKNTKYLENTTKTHDNKIRNLSNCARLFTVPEISVWTSRQIPPKTNFFHNPFHHKCFFVPDGNAWQVSCGSKIALGHPMYWCSGFVWFWVLLVSSGFDGCQNPLDCPLGFLTGSDSQRHWSE